MIANNSKLTKQIRCAIYTRKSTTEGLEQEFNSLDAQRESGSSYIASQRGEGWIEIEDRYDDGGFTGGNMDRPALKRLMNDIAAGKVDCVVVYKVDRLSRSLLDFTRIMETFDRAGASFVSVTQQFNTTSSMGRLTLNILLSFAQFEREIISERTRDKMGAARRKGKYLGGRPLLGYDINRETKRLIVNEREAEQVREIFSMYLEHEGLLPTVEAIHQRGWRTKLWTTKAGKAIGNIQFTKNQLHLLLTNPIYLGKVVYQDECYEGEHDAIIDPATFDLVKKTLRGNRINASDRVHIRSDGVLAKLLHCTACGCLMTHSTSGGPARGKRYRYYVCGSAQKRGRKTCPRPSLPADEVERFVVGQLQALTIDEDLLRDTCDRVRTSVTSRLDQLRQKHAAVFADIRQTTKAIDALSTPTQDTARESLRVETLASLTDQLRRDEKRQRELETQIEAAAKATPDRSSILKAINDLESLWEHLSIAERSRLITLLIDRIEHDPVESTISITLSPTGLNSFGTNSRETMQ